MYEQIIETMCFSQNRDVIILPYFVIIPRLMAD